MNTKGHHGIADEVGLPLLKAAFGGESRSLGAFYMGNWLTDVSQAVDPVPYAVARGKVLKKLEKIDAAVAPLMKLYEGVIDRIFATLFDQADIEAGGVGEQVLETLREKLELEDDIAALKAGLQAAIDALVLGRTETRDTRLGDFFRNVFLVNGYFKFVHPEKAGAEDRMDFEAFMAVFGRPGEARGASPGRPADDRPGAYTQYYPHEHLDRPQVDSDPSVFAPGRQEPGRPRKVGPTPGGSRDGGAPRPGPRAPSNPETIEPDIYSYLRDDMECTAGLLAEVDEAFAKALESGFDDNDPRWHLTLAKAGHALHQVEDFFAHSNWVELAAGRMGPKFMDKVLPPKTGNKLLDMARTIYMRRRRRYINPPPGMDPALAETIYVEDEDWVVTGYFDTQDTIISLLHISEEGLGFDVTDPFVGLHDKKEAVDDIIEDPTALVSKAQGLMRDTMEFALHPEREWENDDNEIAQKIKGPFEDWVKSVQRPPLTRDQVERIARRLPLISEAPPEIVRAFVNTIILGTQVHAAVKPAKSLYEGMKEIQEFVEKPVDYVIDKLSGKLEERAKDALKFYAKELLYESIGARRIGSHSLLAKDHGAEPLFQYQRACAAAVHWYVVRTLLRDRSDPDVPAYIDWLELLEFFLRNPLAPRHGSSDRFVWYTVSATLLYVTRPGDQLDSTVFKHSLAKRFAASAAAPRAFTWRTIADANFATYGLEDALCRTVINATLRDGARGIAVTPPNYAFRPGLLLLIPHQKVTLKLPVAATDRPEWWMQVLEERDWKVLRGREEEKLKLSTVPFAGHDLSPLKPMEHRAQIARGRALRQALRADYRPQVGPGAKRSSQSSLALP